MKENEEITNLERFELLIEDCKGHRELYGESSVGEYDIEIMQHILSDYKRVLKENKELKSKNKTLEELLQGNLYELYKYYKELSGTYQENCILVQKVKDKIEYLDKQQKQWLEDRELKASDSEIIFARDFLQELLEGRKEK